MTDPEDEYCKLKRSFKDIVETFNLNLMDGKTSPQILALGSQFKREILVEAVLKLKNLCEKTFGMYENNVNSTPSTVVSDIVDKVKNAMTEMVPALVTNALKERNVDNDVSKSGVVGDDKKHVMVVEDKQNKENRYDNESWSKVVKSSLSTKLKNIPVEKSLVTKSGKGCLFFPTQSDQEKAKSVLESEYTVSLSTENKRMLLPKLKVSRIGPSYKKEDKEVLKMAIIKKNANIASYVDDNHIFEVIIIDEIKHYAVLKVSPEIRNTIIGKGSVFLDMESLEVKDHFHAVQCFSCQEYGHKKGDDACKHKGTENVTCLYCGENHQSRSCTVKKDSSKFKCSNCFNSKNVHHRQNAIGHTTTSRSCPFSVQQVKSLINRTQGLNEKNYFP